MARITRKDLKTDKFALEVEHTVDYVGEHRQQFLRYGAVVLVVVLIGFGFYLYRKHQHSLRQEELAQAMQIQEAPVAATPPQGALVSFTTQQAKTQEATKAFAKLASEHSGTDEGLIATYYLGTIAADQGKLAEAEKFLKQVADSGNQKYSSLAKLSLAQIYFADGRPDQGEKLLRSLMDNPTVFVSREQAVIVLARGLAKTKPAEARKLLEPLRTSRSSVSQTAITALTELPSQ